MIHKKESLQLDGKKILKVELGLKPKSFICHWKIILNMP